MAAFTEEQVKDFSIKNWYDLSGQVAVVTGGATGLGLAITRCLVSAGAKVAIVASRAPELVADTLAEFGDKAVYYQFNITDTDHAQELADKITAEQGPVSILVNNAGITRDNLIVRMTEEEFNAVLDTNLKGAFHMIRHLTKTFMKQRYGKIINISSVSGIVGNAGQANYSASKAGLIGLTKSVARELASRNICVNAVAPGFIRTDMTDKLPEAVQDNAVGQIPLKKMGRPEDVAQAVLFLAGDASDYITGQVLCVDGGMAM